MCSSLKDLWAAFSWGLHKVVSSKSYVLNGKKAIEGVVVGIVIVHRSAKIKLLSCSAASTTTGDDGT